MSASEECARCVHHGACGETMNPHTWRDEDGHNICDDYEPKKEMVDHPSHYKAANGMEVIDVIEAYGLGFNLGNAVKYILRAGHKGNRVEDLKKAAWYVAREIGRKWE